MSGFPRAQRFLPLSSLLALLAACDSGGSGSEPDTVVQFAASSSTAAEGGAPDVIVVRLATVLPSLAHPVVVLARNAGTGSALNGVDVAPVPDLELTFPAGSLDGDEQSFAVSALADSAVEGADETLRLELALDSGPAAVGALRTHVVTIDDADVALLKFHDSASATIDESSAATLISVELELPLGTSLATSVRARASDAHLGSAAAGGDYQTFAPVDVAFAPGALDGALAFVQVTVVQDALYEGDENVVLTLANPSAGAELGAAAQHVLTIIDDDFAPAPKLTVTNEAGGPLPYGALVDVGPQFAGAGPNAGVRIAVESTGPTALALDLPLIAGVDERDFSLVLETGATSSGFDVSAPARPAPLRRVADGRRSGCTLELVADELAGPAPAGAVVWTHFPLPDGRDVALWVEPAPSPWAEDARIAVDGVPLDESPRDATAALALWRGHVLGAERSFVFLALSPEGARGWVELDGDTLVLEPEMGATGRSLAISQRELDALGIVGPQQFCEDALEAPESQSPSFPPPESTPGASFARCRIALESDHQLYQRFASVPALTSYVTQLVAAASARYRIDVQTELEIAYLGVHAQPGDGWTTPDLPGTPTQMLDEFRIKWSPATGGAWPATAHLAHFLSGAQLGGGVAYLGVVCNPNFGFGVSGNLNGMVPWASWTGAAGPLNWDFVVFAHEVGHNFAASHTHAYCPPLDKCATSCQGASVCSTGTLMSYCHLCAGGMSNIELVFHPFVANVMRSAANNSCLGGTHMTNGVQLFWRVRFAPTIGVGLRHATLSFEHDADNAPTPFTLELRGTAVP